MRMFKHHILNRFLTGHFARAFFMIFGAIFGIIFLFTMINTAVGASSASPVPMAALLEISLAGAFGALEVLLPLSVLIAGTIAFWRMSRSSELTIIRSVGISVWSFLSPMVLACALIGAAHMAVLNPISAVLNRRVEKISYRYGMSHSNPMLFSQNGLWLKERREDGRDSFLYAGSVKRNGNSIDAKDITIFEIAEDSRIRRTIEAKSGNLTETDLRLKDVRTVSSDLAETQSATMSYPTQLSVDKIEENSSKPESFSFWSLPSFIEFFESAGFSARRHKAHFYSLLFTPLTLISMLFISAIFSISPKRNQAHLFIKLSGGIGIGFVAFFLAQVVKAMGAAGRMPVLLSCISIPLVALLVSSTALLEMEDG
ncbi:MAG: LptF/LptG family permease [Rickettsiales bacterium]|jgi:lipopolysaccharide export system permease protein|nr:LptF/LptG family permease [Rickettsiales bacterium]